MAELKVFLPRMNTLSIVYSNVDGALFLPYNLRHRGIQITMSSVLGLAGAAQVSDYAASKAALIALNDSLRYELDKHYAAPGVRTTLFVPGHILTPMFSRANYPSGRLYQFFFPSLHPVEVAKAVIRAIDDQHSQTVYMPFFANFAPFLRSLPSFLRDFAQWVTHADYTMKGFEKVSGRRADEQLTPSSPTEKSLDSKEK
ncbi:hypothetical protein PUNSTDRAFT_43416 [Punctularia strigosozonata HHB-11173 SS5]|uniref:uncharacterized protein n=1 Tax=Punctularia strigosozonata (strain HHB-11173) TaxID=741275 RepID=UPI00044174B4|nr:uncharacterized protein PUNSTDRAFT_43416 [Punctularia strigosozonata HHB-11173 SS5]EIN10537.1 hypothetical protein PUNSTDRAFT_43416 [Punctularia strigosozonata HHB-11173 SS5]